jgi:hypothetical protein
MRVTHRRNLPKTIYIANYSKGYLVGLARPLQGHLSLAILSGVLPREYVPLLASIAPTRGPLTVAGDGQNDGSVTRGLIPYEPTRFSNVGTRMAFIWSMLNEPRLARSRGSECCGA